MRRPCKKSRLDASGEETLARRHLRRGLSSSRPAFPLTGSGRTPPGSPAPTDTFARYSSCLASASLPGRVTVTALDGVGPYAYTAAEEFACLTYVFSEALFGRLGSRVFLSGLVSTGALRPLHRPLHRYCCPCLIPSRSTIYGEIQRKSPYEIMVARYGKRCAEIEFRVSELPAKVHRRTRVSKAFPGWPWPTVLSPHCPDEASEERDPDA